MEAAMKFEYTDGNIIRFCPNKGKKPSASASSKKAGVKSEVYAYQAEDVHKMLDYMADNRMWIHYLVLVTQLSIARRNGDVLSLRWKHFFDPKTGEFRKDMAEFREEKTGKFANPHIGEALKNAINLYIEKTRCKPSANNYENFVFMQLNGNYAGRVLSYSACIKTLKKVAKEVGVEYNVGTHSARKTFGATVMKLHPQDPRALEVVSGFYNHSSTRITEAYTGRTKETVDAMVDEVSEFVDRYMVNGETFEMEAASPVVSLKSEDLRALLKAAYEAGRANAESDDPMVHMDAFAALMTEAEGMIRK